MKSEKKYFSRILPVLLAGGVFALAGCSSDDLYNPETAQKAAQQAFPVKNIDPNQTWETSAVCRATVSVKEAAGETYTIKVLTDNPYNVGGKAALLATASVTGGASADFRFDVPATLQRVYVMKVDAQGYSSAVPATIENGTLNVAFGETSATKAATTRGIVQTRTTTWTPEEIPTSAPTGSIYLSTLNDQWNDAKEGANYIVTSSITQINLGKSANLYISGNVSLTFFYANGGGKIFVLPDAKLTLLDGGTGSSSQDKDALVPLTDNLSRENRKYRAFSMQQGNVEVIVAGGGEIYSEEGIVFNSNNVYNGGKITATYVELNESSCLINEGTMNVELLSVANTASKLENNGSIKAKGLVLAGEGPVFTNTGSVVVTGNSEIANTNSTWINEGYFQTTNLYFGAASKYWYNRCKLIVDEDFNITTNNCLLQMEKDAYAECKNLNMSNACVELNNSTYFKVIETATFTSCYMNQWSGSRGFIAPTEGDYAVLEMGKATTGHEYWQDVSYNGKIYVACNDHFSGDTNGNAFTTSSDVLMSGKSGAKVSIKNTTCNPGYNSTPDGGGSNEPLSYTYAFEDMDKTVGDYDFNDVVLYVTVPYEKNGKKYIDVTLKAVGAEKAVAVYLNYNGTKTIFADAHAALGVTVGTIANTGWATGTEKTETVEVDDSFNLTEKGDIYIVSDTKRAVHIPNFTEGFKAGDAPYALRVACKDWKWPLEMVSINEAYTGFAVWAQNAVESIDWYNSPTAGKVFGN